MGQHRYIMFSVDVVEMRVHDKSHNMLGSPQSYHESTHSSAHNTHTVGLGQVQVVATHGNIGDTNVMTYNVCLTMLYFCGESK